MIAAGQRAGVPLGLLLFWLPVARAIRAGGSLRAQERPNDIIARPKHMVDGDLRSGAVTDDHLDMVDRDSRSSAVPDNQFDMLPDDFRKRAEHIQNDMRYFDGFFFAYWGTVAVLLALALFLAIRYEAARDEFTVTVARLPSNTQIALGAKQELELAPNMWALNLVASLGQARLKRGWQIPLPVVGVICVVMGSLQFLALCLIVNDLDPTARPITEVPSSAWKKDPWTVNVMKWLMVSYMSIHSVEEAAQVKQIWVACAVVSSHRLEYGRFWAVLLGLCQYCVLLFVVWAGVSAVLSHNSVPDILYSSMAIMFIINVDETIFAFFKEVFDVEADFEVVHPKGVDSDEIHQEEVEKGNFTGRVEVLMKFAILLPVVWGIFFLLRAWNTNIMPTDRVLIIRNVIERYFEGS